MTILTEEDINSELEAVIFYEIIKEMGFPDVFTCPVSLGDPQPWHLEEDFQAPFTLNRLLALLSPTTSMPILEVS